MKSDVAADAAKYDHPNSLAQHLQWVEPTDYFRGLDKCPDGSKIPEISGKISVPFRLTTELPSGFMKPTAVAKPPAEKDHESV